MTATVAAPAPLEVRQIPIEKLTPSPFNPRKTVDVAFLAQLADSICQLGIQVPLLVRPVFSLADGELLYYEIVAGHRRFFAAETLKLAELPCIVREMSDEEAREIMVVENLQREDLPPLEEADAYEALRESHGSAEAVAARVGKPVEYVTRRLKLRALIGYSRQALAEKLITLDHALLLAKLADAEQETALRYALKRHAGAKEKTEQILADAVKWFAKGRSQWGGYWQPESVTDLKRFIEDEIKLELKRAPWDLADAELLPRAGACSSCAKNTAANTALFGDLTVKDARCTDAVCFNAKRDAFVQLQLAAVESAGAGAVRISWKATSSAPRALDDAGSERCLRQVFKAGQWIEAKKGSCANLRTGVSVDFGEQTYGTPDAKKKPGMKLLVCVAPGCKTHPKDWEKAAKQAAGNGLRNENSAEARAEREKRLEAAKVENAVRAELVKQAVARVAKLSGELLRRVVLRALPSWPDPEDQFPGLTDRLKKSKTDSADFARAAAALLFCPTDRDEGDDVFVADWQKPEVGREEFLELLKLFGVDGGAAWKKPGAAALAKTPVKAAKKVAEKKAAKKVAKKGGKR